MQTSTMSTYIHQCLKQEANHYLCVFVVSSLSNLTSGLLFFSKPRSIWTKWTWTDTKNYTTEKGNTTKLLEQWYKRPSQLNKTMLSSEVAVWTIPKKSARQFVEIMHGKVTSLCHVTPWQLSQKELCHTLPHTHDW